jgi:serine/threonine protein phosphatase PrpC
MRPPRFSADEPATKHLGLPLQTEAVDGRMPQSRDRVERAPDKLLAAVSDRGKAYPTNQDDIRVRKTTVDAAQATIMIICDGVSSGQNADLASASGAQAAMDFLVSHLTLGGDPRDGMRQAILAADAAIRQVDYKKGDRSLDPPGSTIVAAIALRKRLIVGWVGDSRCYLIDKNGAQQLTHDHSWVNEVVDSGVMTKEKALNSREAHQISRCLGPLFGNRKTDIPDPAITVVPLPDSGIILLCSDGFWNYVSTLDDMAALVNIRPGAPNAITQARGLVDFALRRGGKDNISVALMIKPA